VLVCCGKRARKLSGVSDLSELIERANFEFDPKISAMWDELLQREGFKNYLARNIGTPHLASANGLVNKYSVRYSRWQEYVTGVADALNMDMRSALSTFAKNQYMLGVVLHNIHSSLDTVWVNSVLNQIYLMPPNVDQPRVSAQLPVAALGDDGGVGRAGLLMYMTLAALLQREPSHYQLAGYLVDPCKAGETTYTIWFGLRPTGMQDLAHV
jgi:hypothetical protein